MRLILILCVCALSACTRNAPLDDYSHYLRNKNIPAVSKNTFPHCYDYGCKTIKMVSLTDQQWNQINQNFKPTPKNARTERVQIAKAIQSFEIIVGGITGTQHDKHGTFRLYQDKDVKYNRFQQDCVDESTNTTVYLSLLHQSGLIKFHRPTQPQSRQPFLGGNRWWHQTSTIRDLETGQQYAVDSWFEDNGKPAHIVDIKTWFNGWKPYKSDKTGS